MGTSAELSDRLNRNVIGVERWSANLLVLEWEYHQGLQLWKDLVILHFFQPLVLLIEWMRGCYQMFSGYMLGMGRLEFVPKMLWKNWFRMLAFDLESWYSWPCSIIMSGDALDLVLDLRKPQKALGFELMLPAKFWIYCLYFHSINFLIELRILVNFSQTDLLPVLLASLNSLAFLLLALTTSWSIQGAAFLFLMVTLGIHWSIISRRLLWKVDQELIDLCGSLLVCHG